MSETKPSPANAPAIPLGYKPMTSGVLRLEVPERAGYHRHWFRGTPERIARAQQAGYAFVEPDQVHVNNLDIGGSAEASGNTDLGSRVSVVSGDDVDRSGQPGRMYLMECPEHLYEHSQKVLADINEGVAEALRGGRIGVGQTDETRADEQSRYVKGATPDLFNPNKTRRS